MGKLILYGLDPSPPVRSCLLTLKALGIPYEYKRVDFAKKEHLSKEFMEKNPQHTVPLLDDDGHYIWDSHAIMAYLVSKYGKDDSLYPKDLLMRAVVDQRLHFESGVVFNGAFRNISYFLFFRNETDIPQYKIDAVIDVYNFMETFLKDNDYIAGPQLTIADFSLVSTLTTLEAFVTIEEEKWPKVFAWIKRLKLELPYFEEIDIKGAKMYIDFVKMKNFKIVPSN